MKTEYLKAMKAWKPGDVLRCVKSMYPEVYKVGCFYSVVPSETPGVFVADELAAVAPESCCRIDNDAGVQFELIRAQPLTPYEEFVIRLHEIISSGDDIRNEAFYGTELTTLSAYAADLRRRKAEA